MKIINQDWGAEKILDDPCFPWIGKDPPLVRDGELCREVDGLLPRYKYFHEKSWKEVVGIFHKTAIDIIKNGYPTRKTDYRKGKVQPVCILCKDFSGKVELTRENAPDVFSRYSMMEMWTEWLIWSVENVIRDHLSRRGKENTNEGVSPAGFFGPCFPPVGGSNPSSRGDKRAGRSEEKYFPCTFKGDLPLLNIASPAEAVHFVKAWIGLNAPNGPPPQFGRCYGPPGPQGVTIPASGMSCEYPGPPVEPPCPDESGPSAVTPKVAIGDGSPIAGLWSLNAVYAKNLRMNNRHGA